MENNQRILRNIHEALKAIIMTSNDKAYGKKLVEDIAGRLDVGAEKYGEQTPIDKKDNPDRDNLYEAYEELCDTLVYLSATCLRITEEISNTEPTEAKKRINEYFIDILRITMYIMHELKVKDE